MTCSFQLGMGPKQVWEITSRISFQQHRLLRLPMGQGFGTIPIMLGLHLVRDTLFPPKCKYQEFNQTIQRR